MSIRQHALLLVAVLMICGCAVQSRYIDTRNVLDKSLYYSEQDPREQEPRAISEAPKMKPDTAKRKPTRVPHPALVDIDSTIYIQVDKGPLSMGTDEGLLARRSKALLERKERIHQALEAMEKVVVARLGAVKAYKKSDSNFKEQKKKLKEAKEVFLTRLKVLWQKTSPEKAKMYNEMSLAFDPPHFVKFQKFLQARIDEIEEEDRAITKELKERKMVSLRLEAFLEQGDNRDPVAIHLDGYDSLDAGKSQRRDRLGLDLSNQERARLKEQVSATLKLVDAAERVRREELSLRDALRETIPVISPRFNRLMQKVESLEGRLNKDALDKRLDKTKEIFNEFVEEVERQAGELSESIENDLKKMPQSYKAFLEEESGPYVEALTLYAGLQQLEERWTTATDLETELVLGSVGLAGDLRRLLPKLRELKADDMEGHLSRFLKAEFSSMVDDVSKTLINVANSEAANNLRTYIEEFYKDLESVREITEEGIKILEALGELEEQEIALGTRVPESLKIPLSDIQDTFIELDHTPRLPGDTITVRATLSKDKDPTVKEIETTASFQVEKFGWYAELSPAVVLAKPDKLKGGNDGFRFAPTLSWMHHYVPRPDASSWYSSFLRGLQPAVGMHSAFLNFNPEGSGETIQIGLGTTLSFWENRLQFGAGYNLMAASDDEGKFYYFVGTDLIGILQSVGIGQ